MPYTPKVQSAPLGFTGVPDAGQIAVPASMPAPQPPPPGSALPMQQQPFSHPQAEAQAIAREQALQSQAQQAIPGTDTATILAALAGIAGNVAGALSGRGAVGNPGVQLAGNLYDRNRQKQREFADNVKAEEQRIKMEQQQAAQLRDKQLIADSLVPLINRVPDPAEKAALFRMAAADPSAAYGAVNQYWDRTNKMEAQSEALQMKRERFAFEQESAAMRKERSVLDEELKRIKLAKEAKNLANGDNKEFQKVFRTQRSKHAMEYGKVEGIVEPLLQLEAELGGIDSETARQELAKLTGLKGIGAGRYRGDEKARRISLLLNNIITKSKTKDFGSALTATEKPLLDEAMGYVIGGSMTGNVFNTPEKIQEGLRILRNTMQSAVDRTDAIFDRDVVDAIDRDERYSKQIMTSGRFARELENARAAGGIDLANGYKQLGIKADTWLRMTRSEKLEVVKQLKEAAGGQ
jgi:hypothetical protein